jgi:hypothetical protein
MAGAVPSRRAARRRRIVVSLSWSFAAVMALVGGARQV